MFENKIGGRGGNIAYSRAALRQAQITAHYNQIQIQNNVQFVIDGVFGTLAPVDNQALTAGTVITGCNECFFAVWVNNTNVIATTQGGIADPSKLGNGGTSEQVVPYPEVVDNNVLIGLIKVKVGTGVTFTPNTTNFNATNITATFYDTSVMPTVPHKF